MPFGESMSVPAETLFIQNSLNEQTPGSLDTMSAELIHSSLGSIDDLGYAVDPNAALGPMRYSQPLVNNAAQDKVHGSILEKARDQNGNDKDEQSIDLALSEAM